MVKLAIVVFVLLLSSFAWTFYRELKRTPWSLLESLVLFIVLGHVQALPIAYAYERVRLEQENMTLVFRSGAVTLVTGMFMVGGAVWVFRRMNRLGEKRWPVRIAWMMCGMLLFPTMVGPWVCLYILPALFLPALVLSIVVWIALDNLHMETRKLPDPWVCKMDRKSPPTTPDVRSRKR